IFRLDNGLTVIVHEDRKAPIVAVNVWYHVGSKNEKPGKTGFAHLFEHLMFQGTEHYNDEYFGPLEKIGATTLNGTTSFDRTNYFQNVPTTALDTVLWMESDRMGHLLGVIDQARLDEQRGVVQNEKRQGENQPYGRVFEALATSSFPSGHPYRWLPIGSMEDLDRASLDDVKGWFKEYYGASNAIIVLAGDIDVQTAREKSSRFFGHIPGGVEPTRLAAWTAARTEETRQVMYDRIAQSRLYRSHNVPAFGTDDAALLELAAHVLGGGKTSRLYERLVYRERLADSASSSIEPFEIAGLFLVVADVKRGIDRRQVEAALDEELGKFLAGGPTKAELAAARTALRASFVRGLERIGGVGGKADVLAQCFTYAGDPSCYKRMLAAWERATPGEVRRVARRWLSQGAHTLEVHPVREHTHAAQSVVDRKAGVPFPTSFPGVAFPALERGRLANGMPVIVAHRPGLPLVRTMLAFDAGYAADEPERVGAASFTFGMLDEGTTKLDALEIAARAEELGAVLGTDSTLDSSAASVTALTDKLDPSLALLADVVRNPAFPQGEIDRVRKEWLAAIEREKAQPEGVALRVLPPLLYGESHPYAIPLSGSGTPASIESLRRDDLLAFHSNWIRPDNATIIVVGDASLAQVLPLLEKHFGTWAPPAAARGSKRAVAKPRETTRPAAVYLIDKPGAIQSTILVGLRAPSSSAPNRLEMNTMDRAFGGLFTSRINMNLREKKAWSYGTFTSFPEAVNERPWLLIAPVQSDKTVESIGEIRREMSEYLAARPVTAAEIETVKNRDVRALSGRFETHAAVANAIRDNVVFGRPDDYVQTLASRIEAQTEEGIRAAARQVIAPDQAVWVVVGDLARIEAPVRKLGMGAVAVLDADGERLR
ncbi:MAG TPA: pitrilysin family protein, partial [Steroidobacteraceae bacterium]|nr:pitrilysin family protein [Steroidobacteraceae bacterium]